MTIESQFQGFMASIYTADSPGPEPGSVQLQEMRRAFFAGFHCGINDLAGAVAAGNGVRELVKWNKEITSFVNDVVRGLA